mgnify:CR=1 FL=1
MASDLMAVYNRAPVEVDHGEGAWLHAADGRVFLDCVAGIATNGLGHAHPALVRALTDQANKLWHVSNIFRIPGQEELARKLVESSFADVVFFGNSGSEAVECALKTARRYHVANGAPERIDIFGFAGSFHGRTYAAINAAGNPSYVEGFGPRLPQADGATLVRAGRITTVVFMVLAVAWAPQIERFSSLWQGAWPVVCSGSFWVKIQ